MKHKSSYGRAGVCRERAFHGPLLLVAGVALVAVIAHCRGIVSVSLEVVAESRILEGDCVLVKGQCLEKVLCFERSIPG